MAGGGIKRVERRGCCSTLLPPFLAPLPSWGLAMTWAEELGRQVHARRLFLHLTVREAAEQVGLPSATFNRIENGKGDPRMSAAEKVREWLERTSFEEFL